MPYLDTGLCHVTNLFLNIWLETVWLRDVQLQNYDAVNLCSFFLEQPGHGLVTVDNKCVVCE